MRIFLFSAFLLLLFGGLAFSQPCGECHSKNPKLVKMHEAIGFQKCVMCHQGGIKKSPSDVLQKRMSEEPVCVKCHGKDSLIK